MNTKNDLVRIAYDWQARAERAEDLNAQLLEALRQIDDLCRGDLPLTAQVKDIAAAAIKAAGG